MYRKMSLARSMWPVKKCGPAGVVVNGRLNKRDKLVRIVAREKVLPIAVQPIPIVLHENFVQRRSARLRHMNKDQRRHARLDWRRALTQRKQVVETIGWAGRRLALGDELL